MRFFNQSHLALVLLLGVVTACTVNVTAPAAQPTTVSAATSARAPDSSALQEARKKVRDINWEIGQAESELRQLSPPVRITDSKGTTFDADKQRQYDNNRARVDRKIRELKEERTIWELRVSQLALVEDALKQNAAVLAPTPAPAPVATQLAPAPESAALTEARKKVRDVNWEIGQAESALRQLAPPVRITDSKGTTFDADKQRQHELNRARIDRQIRDLKEERTTWELRVNQLALAEEVQNRR